MPHFYCGWSDAGHRLGRQGHQTSISNNYHPCSPPATGRFNEFEALEQFFTGPKPGRPWVFHDLEEAAENNLQFSALPIEVRVDYFKLTDATVLTPITISFANRTTFAIYGRVTTTGNEVVEFEERTENASCSTARFLFPGPYRLQVAAKEAGGNMVTYERRLEVPRMDSELVSSSVVLADTEPAAPYFVVGEAEVRPRLSNTYHRGDTFNVFLQLYNLLADENHRPNGLVRYQLKRSGSDIPFWTRATNYNRSQTPPRHRSRCGNASI